MEWNGMEWNGATSRKRKEVREELSTDGGKQMRPVSLK
jgi:hypothetical protein